MLICILYVLIRHKNHIVNGKYFICKNVAITEKNWANILETLVNLTFPPNCFNREYFKFGVEIEKRLYGSYN